MSARRATAACILSETLSENTSTRGKSTYGIACMMIISLFIAILISHRLQLSGGRQFNFTLMNSSYS